MYPKKTLMKEVSRYTKELVKSKRAMGELGHPEGPTLNLERVSHIITELKEEDARDEAYDNARADWCEAHPEECEEDDL